MQAFIIKYAIREINLQNPRNIATWCSSNALDCSYEVPSLNHGQAANYSEHFLSLLTQML